MTPNPSITPTRTARETGDWLTRQEPLPFDSAPLPDMQSILVDPGKRFQTLLGFGGAFTEAAAVTFYKMDAVAQAAILKAYFDPKEGNAYTLCRTTINSCDFSLGNYAYAETPGDIALAHFSIEHDRQALIPLIHAATQASGGKLALFASPWSPPAWMKTNNEMNHGGRLLPQYRQTWARYYARYIQAYAAEGIPIWGLTVQNEPDATQTWDSCLYSAEEERDFVRDHLGPELAASGLGSVRLIVHDHNRDFLYQRAKVIYDDSKAAQYVWGAGFHWYVGDHFDNVQALHDAYPDKHLLFTEGCLEGGAHKDEWAQGERYARSMINDLNRWTEAWTDWNLLLDEQGGPNHVGNYCAAPVIADTRIGTVKGLTFQSSYAYIGHFSRFIRPGAQRVVSVTTLDELETTAFRNTDGQLAVVVMNRGDADLPFALRFAGLAAPTTAPAHSITTYCFEG
jgi:glucosylceramidase